MKWRREMIKQKVLLTVSILILFTSCSKNSKCEEADIFGHCKKWQGQEQTCKDSFMGFCRDKK